jgi:hypothetical protein
MRWVRKRVVTEAEILAIEASALESNAARAGAALGCCYANSLEYEAELIAARRAAGVYGPRRRSWTAPLVFAASLAAVVVLIVLAK